MTMTKAKADAAVSDISGAGSIDGNGKLWQHGQWVHAENIR